MKNLFKRITYLNIFFIYDSETGHNCEDEDIFVWIHLFENLVKLIVVFRNPESVNRLFQEMMPSVDLIFADNYKGNEIPSILTDDIQNLDQLRCLQIPKYRAPKQTIEKIITSLNLKRFEFSSNEMTSILMQKM